MNAKFRAEQRMYPEIDHGDPDYASTRPRMRWVVVCLEDGEVFDAPFDDQEETEAWAALREFQAGATLTREQLDLLDSWFMINPKGDRLGRVMGRDEKDFEVDTDEDGVEAWDERRREIGVM
jgi:hypothetical protein